MLLSAPLVYQGHNTAKLFPIRAMTWHDLTWIKIMASKEAQTVSFLVCIFIYHFNIIVPINHVIIPINKWKSKFKRSKFFPRHLGMASQTPPCSLAPGAAPTTTPPATLFVCLCPPLMCLETTTKDGSLMQCAHKPTSFFESFSQIYKHQNTFLFNGLCSISTTAREVPW